MTYLGNGNIPEIIYGINGALNWKNLDFSFLFQGAARVQVYLQGGVIQPYFNQGNLPQFWVNESWTEQNINAKYPRLTIERSANNATTSTYWERDGAFLKLKNAEIGYTFKSMRFYLRGSNLLTFSKFKLWDPEMGGGAGMKYPTQRTYNVGIQLTFK